jgi:hypothetical protein
MRERIERWIAGGCNYAEGVAIYAEYGTNSALKTLFNAGASPFTQRKLRDELTAMDAAAKPKSRNYSKPKYQVTDLTPELQTEFTEKGKLFKEASALHGDLFHARTDKDRAHIREEIVKRFDRISDIWNKADAYIIREREISNDPVKLVQERNNIRSQLSKARKANNPEKIARLTATLDQLNKKINE